MVIAITITNNTKRNSDYMLLLSIIKRLIIIMTNYCYELANHSCDCLSNAGMKSKTQLVDVGVSVMVSFCIIVKVSVCTYGIYIESYGRQSVSVSWCLYDAIRCLPDSMRRWTPSKKCNASTSLGSQILVVFLFSELAFLLLPPHALTLGPAH